MSPRSWKRQFVRKAELVTLPLFQLIPHFLIAVDVMCHPEAFSARVSCCLHAHFSLHLHAHRSRFKEHTEPGLSMHPCLACHVLAGWTGSWIPGSCGINISHFFTNEYQSDHDKHCLQCLFPCGTRKAVPLLLHCWFISLIQYG